MTVGALLKKLVFREVAPYSESMGLRKWARNVVEVSQHNRRIINRILAGFTTENDIEITDDAKGLILVSPNGTRYRVTVDNSGNLIRTSL